MDMPGLEPRPRWLRGEPPCSPASSGHGSSEVTGLSSANRSLVFHQDEESSSLSPPRELIWDLMPDCLCFCS